MKRICLVTEEIAGIGLSGGIGGAFSELALFLSEHHQVDVLLCPISPLSDNERRSAIAHMEDRGIRLAILDTDAAVWGTSPEKRSYCVFQYLRKCDGRYDVVHFHDYKGLGFFSQSAKQQGIAFAETIFVVQLHGPTRWTLSANNSTFTHEDQLKIDFLERESIRRADRLVSPSQYLVEWLQDNGFDLPDSRKITVIKNLCLDLKRRCTRLLRASGGTQVASGFEEVIFFARHEDRKGLGAFCGALDLLNEKFEQNKITATFLGRFGDVNGQHSGIFLASRSKNWRFPISVLPHLNRNQAAEYLASSR